MTQKLRLLVSLILLCGISISCINTSHNLSKEKLDYVKSTYSSEVINYFYETNFYSEGVGKKGQFSRWKNDVNIKVLGNYTDKDIVSLNYVIAVVDSLKLPIKFKIVDSIKSANFIISYGGIIDNNQNIGGICTLNSDNTFIYKAKISIYERERKVIEEEFIQGLGVACDSYSHPNSLFTEGRNTKKFFTNVDKRVLQLLYDDVWPSNYNRIDFEKDFSDVLYSVNTSEKIKKYLKDNKVKQEVLNEIRNNCFGKEKVLVKHPNDVAVRLHGDFRKNDSLQVVRIIDAINKIGSNLNLKLEAPVDTGVTYGIDLRISDLEISGSRYTTSVSKGLNTMFPKIFNNNVLLEYDIKSQSQININKKITEFIYKCLIPLEDISSKYKIINNELVFSEELESIVKLVYNDVFADAYKLSDFDNLIKEYNRGV
ncbi:MAG: DUF2927 domain-containing protein [Marinifilaceae bacterium]